MSAVEFLADAYLRGYCQIKSQALLELKAEARLWDANHPQADVLAEAMELLSKNTGGRVGCSIKDGIWSCYLSAYRDYRPFLRDTTIAKTLAWLREQAAEENP